MYSLRAQDVIERISVHYFIAINITTLYGTRTTVGIYRTDSSPT